MFLIYHWEGPGWVDYGNLLIVQKAYHDLFFDLFFSSVLTVKKKVFFRTVPPSLYFWSQDDENMFFPHPYLLEYTLLHKARSFPQ